jgi:hypothetical protein
MTLKTITQLILLSSFLLTGGILQAQQIKLKGNIYYQGEAIKAVSLQVRDDEKILEETTSSSSGKFKLKMEGRMNVRILVFKEGFISKEIILSATDLPNNKLVDFAFDIELHKERHYRYVDRSKLEGPVAEIYYDKKKDALLYDKQLTVDSHQLYEELKEENNNNRRKKYSAF